MLLRLIMTASTTLTSAPDLDNRNLDNPPPTPRTVENMVFDYLLIKSAASINDMDNDLHLYMGTHGRHSEEWHKLSENALRKYLKPVEARLSWDHLYFLQLLNCACGLDIDCCLMRTQNKFK